MNNAALNKPAAKATAASSTMPKNSPFKIESGPNIGSIGLLTSNQFGANSTPSTLVNPQTAQVAADQKQRADFKAKYGFDMPGTPLVAGSMNNIAGVKAKDPNQNQVQPKTTLGTKDQSPSTVSGTNTQINAPGGVTSPSFTPYSNATVGTPANTTIAPTVSQPTGPYQSAVSGLVGMAGQPGAAYTNQMNTANDINAQLAQSRTQEAQALANNASPADQYGRSIEYQQGAGGILQNLFLNQQNALASQFQGATNLVNAANTQQGLQQSAYSSAAGLTTPQLGQYGQAYYNPYTAGQAGGGSGVSPSDPFYATLQNYAQMAANGQYAGIPSSITGNAVLNNQMNEMAKAINPNYNPVTSSAFSSSQGAQTQQIATWTSAKQQASNLGANLTSLINSAGINPNDVNKLNTAVQTWATNTSSPQYATFHNLVADLSNTYAQVLTPSGGTVTDYVRSISDSLLNPSASGKSILQVISDLDGQVNAKIAGVQTSYNAGTSNGSANTNTSGGANPWH